MYGIATLFCWLSAALHLYRFHSGGRNLASASLLAAFTFKAIAFSLAIPAVYALVDRLLQTPNVSRLLLCVCSGPAWTGAILVALSYWDPAPRIPRAWVGALATGTVATQALLWSRCTQDELDMAFPVATAHFPMATAFLTVFDVALAFGTYQVARRCRTVADLPVQPWLRTGMRVTVAGACLYLIFCVLRLVSIILAHTRIDSTALQALTAPITTVAVSVMAVGLTLPAAHVTATALGTWIRHHRRYRVMYPLWADLRSADEVIVLMPRAAGFGSLSFRVYRRAVEIHDGILRFAPRALQRADSSEVTDVRNTAATIFAELHARSETPAGRLTATPPRAAAVAGPHPETDLEWLAAVAREYRKIRKSSNM